MFLLAVYSSRRYQQLGHVSPTFHHILLVVAVVVTVSGTVVDVKTVDGSVVVAGWDILWRGRAEISRNVCAPYCIR